MSPDRKAHFRPLYPEVEGFPRAEIETIKQRGEQLVSPFWVFSRFGLRYDPQARDLIIAMLSQAPSGNEINFIDTPKGLRIYANNVDPLLEAMDEIYLATLHLLPKTTRTLIDKHFATEKASRDWQK